MFNKLVAIEPVSLIPSAEEALHQYAKEVVLYRDIPASDDQIVQRIGDADAVLLSYTSRMGKNVIERCSSWVPTLPITAAPASRMPKLWAWPISRWHSC